MAVNVAVFVSGNGSNGEQLIKHFKHSDFVNIALVLSNRQDAYALTRAENHNVNTVVLNKKEINDKDVLLKLLKFYHIDFIVLAGFLLMIPDYLIEEYPNKIINLHPALLPKFGGKGMYGHYVHEAVKAAGETMTGFTVHYVSPVCDGGQIIEQYVIDVDPKDTPEDIARKENLLELEYFPSVVERVICSIFK